MKSTASTSATTLSDTLINLAAEARDDPFRISPKRIDVAFLPTLLQPGSLTDRTVIVTDVLRATTTIIQALFSGCTQVIPQPNIEAARARHAQIENSVLGGERGGKIIAGFHHGNSPVEYSRESIGGKSLIMATTNGTVAMESCRTARRVLIGAMVNLGAVADKIDAHEQVTIVCSGTDGWITSEDVIFAGAIIERLLIRSGSPSNLMRDIANQDNGASSTPSIHHHQLSDLALIALNHWQNTQLAIQNGMPLADFFRQARGGINLVKIGLDADIVFAAQIDSVPIVPELNVATWSIGKSG